MAQPTYRAHGIVVRKRALGEADLVVTLLDESGAKIAAVAKGARKPSGTFSSRLELFSRVDVLLVKGRSLDIVKEARLEEGHGALRCDYDLTLAASVAADAVDHLAQESLQQPRIFLMTETLLSVLQDAPPDSSVTLAAAFLLKALATFGYRPALDSCASCGIPVRSAGRPLPSEGARESECGVTPFSVEEGGVLCAECAARLQFQFVSERTIDHARMLMGATFSALAARPMTPADAVDLLHLINLWMGYHANIRLKSLEQLVLSQHRASRSAL